MPLNMIHSVQFYFVQLLLIFVDYAMASMILCGLKLCNISEVWYSTHCFPLHQEFMLWWTSSFFFGSKVSSFPSG